MTRLALVALIAAAAALSAGRANAATVQGAETQAIPGEAKTDQPPLAAEDSRYSFHRIHDGFVRLDSRTGQLAQCGWGASGWSCRAVPDERAALEGEIGRLQRENAALKKSLLTRGLDLPAGIVADAPAAATPGPVPPAAVPDTSRNSEPKGPNDVDLDSAITFVKHVWQRLVDIMVDLQRDIQRKG